MNLTKNREDKEIKKILTENQKQEKIAIYFSKIMETLGLDLKDDSLQDTPQRVAKMYVEEIFSGLNAASKPKVTLFKNTHQYSHILLEKNITFFSCCEHHFVPFFGKIHVAYIPGSYIIGLSKINRIVKYIASRPQVQEKLTMQIAKEFQEILNIKDIAVLVEAKHLCVHMRGIEDTDSSTNTAAYLGKFAQEATKKELHRLLCS